MSINGQIKFFKKNYGDIDVEVATLSASTGSSYRTNVRRRDRRLFWVSSGSDDTTTETLTYDFGASHDVDRLILARHNFKQFDVMYWDGSIWVDFANVVTKEGTQTDVTETVNTKTTSYYEFTSVNTDKIRLRIDKTIAVDAEKTLYQFIVTEEQGTFVGYPQVRPTNRRKQFAKESVMGLPKYSLLNEQAGLSLDFGSYLESADHTLVQTLWDAKAEFLVYPTGGDESQFLFNVEPYRLQDVYLVWFGNDNWSPAYTNTIYQNGLNYQLNLVEVA